jgi:hypothetical protein
METFAQKYPAFAALFGLVATIAQDAAAPGETALQKLEGAVNLVGPVISFLPQASLLSAELAALKESPSDIESAAEALVTDLAFSSEKAKSIIAAAFPLAEAVVALIPQAEALVAAIKA